MERSHVRLKVDVTLQFINRRNEDLETGCRSLGPISVGVVSTTIGDGGFKDIDPLTDVESIIGIFANGNSKLGTVSLDRSVTVRNVIDRGDSTQLVSIVLVEVPVMLTLVYFTNFTRKYFEHS